MKAPKAIFNQFKLGQFKPGAFDFGSFKSKFKPTFKGRVKKKSAASAAHAQNHVGIEISKEGLGCATIFAKQGEPCIGQCQYFHINSKEAILKSLTEFVENQSLEGKKCTLSLHPNDYKLLQVEAPDKPLAELKRIMPERVNDLVPWDIAETFTDVFVLPDDAYRGRRKLAYVAVAQKQTIIESLALCGNAGLKPDSISVQELVLRNMQIVYDAPDHSHAVLRLRSKEGVLVLMHGNQVYLTRRLSMPLEKLNDPEANRREIFDSLVLEIQRSLDYYESQMGKGVVESISVLPASVDIELGVQYLETHLGARVGLLSVYDRMHLPQELSLRDKGLCIPAVGAALGAMI